MKYVNFHHLWVGDPRHGANWRPVAEEHFEALRQAEFDGEVHVGLVGGDTERKEARGMLDEWWPSWKQAVVAEEGFEMPTINALHQWAKVTEANSYALYTHGKGSFQDTPGNHDWRQVMESFLVDAWQDRVAELASGDYDAVGLHWLTYTEFPRWIDVHKPMFGGNFWWANADYLAQLPPVEWRSRYCAEAWMGQGYPRVKDLKPGWPMYRADEVISD